MSELRESVLFFYFLVKVNYAAVMLPLARESAQQPGRRPEPGAASAAVCLSLNFGNFCVSVNNKAGYIRALLFGYLRRNSPVY